MIDYTMEKERKNNWRAKPHTIAWVSLFNAIFILMVDYLINNIPYSFFDDIDHYTKLEFLKRSLCGTEERDSDVLYINVSYDKKLIDYQDPDFGFPEGQIDITDRGKLLRFLTIAQKANNYKYIFLDVRFEKGYYDKDSLCDSTIDDVLLRTIESTPRLVLSTHSDITLIDSSLINKAAINDYYATITSTNLIRYQYLHDKEESVPLRMYHDLFGKNIKQCGPLFVSANALCYNCPFLRIPNSFPPKYDDKGNLQYYNIGVDLLESYDENDIANILSGKYVVIGNIIEDVHDTYVGSLPGCFITFNAFKALCNGNHLVSWPFVFIMFFIYTIISVFLFSSANVSECIPMLSRYKSKLFKFIISLLGYTTIILVVSDITYLICGDTFCIWFPSLYFSVFSTIISYKKL